MADVFTPEKRSEVMARIRSKGTKPEERFHALLVELLPRGTEIQRHVDGLPGKPDFVIPVLSLVVFMDGCFYHQCPKHGRIPDTNVDYWKPKLERNVRRDEAARRALRRRGYSVWRFWEHHVKTQAALERTTVNLARRLERQIREVGGSSG